MTLTLLHMSRINFALRLCAVPNSGVPQFSVHHRVVHRGLVTVPIDAARHMDAWQLFRCLDDRVLSAPAHHGYADGYRWFCMRCTIALATI